MKHRTLCLWCLLLVLLCGCGPNQSASVVEDDHSGHDHAGHDHPEDEEAGHLDLTDSQTATADIELTTVELRQMQDALEVPGVVTTTTTGRAILTPPVAGRLVRLDVQPGDTVRRGQTIGIVESPELADAWSRIVEAQQARDAARIRRDETDAEVRLAREKVSAAQTLLDRQKEFAAAGAFNQAPLLAAQAELDDARSELETVEQELETHSVQLLRLEYLYSDGLVSLVDVENARLDVRKDEVNLRRAQQRIQAAETAFAREKKISEQGLLNSREIQTAEANLRTAKLELERTQISNTSAQAAWQGTLRAVASAQSTYRTYTGGAPAAGGRVNLLAPLSGTITVLDATRGQAVDRTQSLAVIENLDSVWVTANVPESEAARLTKGASITLTVPAQPGVSFEGRIEVIGSRLDPATRTVPVQCLVTGANGRLTPQMSASVQIPAGPAAEVMAVPASAVTEKDGEKVVFLVSSGEYLSRPVKTGRESGGYVQIIEGLESGDRIVSQGAFILKSQLRRDELKGHEH